MHSVYCHITLELWSTGTHVSNASGWPLYQGEIRVQSEGLSTIHFMCSFCSMI